MIEMKNMKVKRGGKTILSHPQLRLENGSFVAIAGLNGSGKTSLFNTLSGLDLASCEKLEMNGIKVTENKLPSFARIRAVVPQIDQSQTLLDVHEVLRMGLYQRHIPANIEREIIYNNAMSFELVEFLSRPFNSLSGGEKQRTLIAQALIQFSGENPQDCFLFLDEPTNNLDVAQQYLLMQRLSKLRDKGFGIVAVLHEISQIRKYADRVLFIHDKSIYRDGDPQRILTQELVENVYGIPKEMAPGKMVMNLIEKKLDYE